MTSFGIALTIFIGTMIAIPFVAPNATVWGMVAGGGVVAFINASVAYVILKIATYAWPLFRKQ